MASVEAICQILGDEFIKYVLASESENIDIASLSAAQMQVLDAMEALAASVTTATSPRQAYDALSSIVAYSSEAETTVTNDWRIRCGGDVIDVESDHPTERALLVLARDLYPRFLVPGLVGSLIGINWVFRTWPIQGHPAVEDFARAVLASGELKGIFPDSPDPSTYTGNGADIRSQLLWSNGQGGTSYLAQLPGDVLASAFDLAASPGIPTPEEYLQSVRRTFQTVRRLGSDGKAKAPVLVGLGNLNMAEGLTLEFDGGQLRAPARGDRLLLLQPDGITAVLELASDLELVRAVAWPIGADVPGDSVPMKVRRDRVERFQNGIRRTLNLFRLAMLLASPPNSPVAPTEAAITAINPMQTSRMITPSIYRLPVSSMPPVTISPDLGAEIVRWWPQVRRHPPGLDMTMRRLLSGTARLDPLDGFIDAVICWENMFGSGEGEVTFRVANAIARLLAPGDPKNGMALVAEVKRLYGIRSKLLHGAKEPSASESIDYRNRATSISLRCLRQLYAMPTLLDAKNSAERSQMLIIDAL